MDASFVINPPSRDGHSGRSKSAKNEGRRQPKAYIPTEPPCSFGRCDELLVYLVLNIINPLARFRQLRAGEFRNEQCDLIVIRR
jgi:hypothetical protein